MGSDRIHQRRRQTIIWLEAQFLQPRAHVTHLGGVGATLDRRGDERREFRRRPPLVPRQLGMNKIKPVERVVLILDPPEHVHAAAGAGMALDRGIRIDHLQLVGILDHVDRIARHHRDDREFRARRLPAFGTAARMVMRRLRTHLHNNRIARAFTAQRTARKILRPRNDPLIDGRMN